MSLFVSLLACETIVRVWDGMPLWPPKDMASYKSSFLNTNLAAEYDPQPFHLSDEGAANTMFGTLAASGWHTMALTMRMLVDSVPLADGLIGASTEVAWPRPTRPGMTLQVFSEITDIRPSRSKPDMAMVTMRSETRDEKGDVLLIFTARMPVSKRARA